MVSKGCLKYEIFISFAPKTHHCPFWASSHFELTHIIVSHWLGMHFTAYE